MCRHISGAVGVRHPIRARLAHRPAAVGNCRHIPAGRTVALSLDMKCRLQPTASGPGRWSIITTLVSARALRDQLQAMIDKWGKIAAVLRDELRLRQHRGGGDQTVKP